MSNQPSFATALFRNWLKTKRCRNGTPVALEKPVVTRRLLTLALVAVALPGATLEKLSFEEMTAKSTSIVRAKIGPGTGRQYGALVYTQHTISVLESWKGPSATTMDVVVPGGKVGRMQQTVAGSPVLTAGSELVLFLWKSPRGLTHVIGLSQGVFQLERDAAGVVILSRGPTSSTMVTASGRPVTDEGVRMPLSEFNARVATALGRTR